MHVQLDFEVMVEDPAMAARVAFDLSRVAPAVYSSKLNLALTDAQMTGRLGPDASDLFPVITGLSAKAGLTLRGDATVAPSTKSPEHVGTSRSVDRWGRLFGGGIWGLMLAAVSWTI